MIGDTLGRSVAGWIVQNGWVKLLLLPCRNRATHLSPTRQCMNIAGRVGRGLRRAGGGDHLHRGETQDRRRDEREPI